MADLKYDFEHMPGENPDQPYLVFGPQGEVAPEKNIPVRESMAMKGALAQVGTASKLDVPELMKRFDELKPVAEQTNGYQNVRELVANFKAAGDTDAIKQVLSHYISNATPQQALEFSNKVPDLHKQVEFERKEPDNLERNSVNNISKFDERVREHIIGQQFMYNKVNQIMETEGTLDMISNFGGFLLNDVNIDRSRWTKSTFLNAGKSVQNMIIGFKKLPIDEQQRIFPYLANEIMSASDGNQRKAVGELLKFLRPGYGEDAITESNWDLANWGLDILTVGAPVLTGIGKVYRFGRSSVKLAEAAGNAELAGKATAHALMDETGDAARAVGVERDAAAVDAAGARGRIIDSSLYNDYIGKETRDALHEQEDKVFQFLNNESVLKGNLLTDAERESIKEKYMAKWKSLKDEEPGINDIRPGPDGADGVSMVVTLGTPKKGRLFQSLKGANSRLAALKEQGIVDNSAKVVDTGKGYAIEYTEKLNFTLNDVGEFAGRGGGGAGPVETFLASPSFWMRKVEGTKGRISEHVAEATRIELGGHVLRDHFTKAMNIAIKPLGNVYLPKGRAKLARVDQVLLQGDAHIEQSAEGVITRGKVYTPQELSHGVVVPGKKGDEVIKLTPDEQQAYYGLRRVSDMLYILENQGKRDAMVARGMKATHWEGSQTVIKPLDTPEAAKLSFKGRDVKAVYDSTANRGAGAMVDPNSIDFAAHYAQGYKLVRFGDPVAKDGKYIEYAFLHSSDFDELPQFVLNYKVGYVPKINKDAYYFVKSLKRGNLNGQPGRVVGQTTERMFKSRKEAEAYAAREKDVRGTLREMLMSEDEAVIAAGHKKLQQLGYHSDEIRDMLEKALKGEINLDVEDLRVMTDRELSQERLDQEAAGVGGGLFIGTRATHEITFGLSGEVPKRATAFESLQRNIQHISNYYPRNEWRMGVQQRWLNTAHSLGAVPENITDFRTAVNSLQARVGSADRASLAASARWIMDQARIPTKEEEWFSQWMRGIAEWIDKPVIENGQIVKNNFAREFLSSSLLNLAQKDPYAAARASAFHTLLGWFNPAQLFVQAQGASVAMSIHPESWMKSMQGSFALTTTAFSKNEKYIRNVAKALGMNEDDFIALKKLYDQTGLTESIKATADHAAAAQSYGMTMRAIRQSADKGLMFYRRGELFNRTYSFRTAVDQWLRRNPGKTISDIGKPELKEVLDETMHISLNMTRANRAAWQKGALSLPTQFMQIQAKWVEAMWGLFGKNTVKLTPQQRQRMLIGQMLTYGAAGVPLGSFGLNYALETMGVKPEDMDEETKKLLNGGVWDGLAYSVFGANVELGSRGAIAEGLVRNMYDLVYEQNDASAFLGAFREVPNRLFSGLGHLAPLIANAHKVQWTPQEFAYVGSELAKVTATWRNFTKAYFMLKTKTIIDRNGRVLVDKGPNGFSPGTLVLQSLGFRASESKSVIDLRNFNKMNDQIIADVSAQLITIQHDYLGGLVGEIKDARSAENAQIMTDYLLGNLDAPLRQRVLDNVRNKIMAGSDEETRQIQRYYRLYGDQITQTHPALGGLITNPLLSPKEPK
jgi:hypothetical protein